MQNLHFRGIDDFLDYLPPHERPIVDRLRAIILDCIPNAREQLAYNVPYYYRNARICFIWPASVPWGNVSLNGVQLGFCKGFLLSDELNFLEKGNRKQVFTKTFFAVDDIDEALIIVYLLEAVELDRNLKQK